MSYIFGGNTGISYSQLQKEREREKQLREMADAMQGRIGTPSTFGAGLTALGAGLAARNKRRKAGELEKSNNAAEAAGRERAQSAFQQLWGSRYGATPDSGSTGGTAAYNAMAANGGPTVAAANAMANDPWAGKEDIRAGIFAGESGGDYDALFGYSQRDGGRFAGVKPTEMTVGQVAEFTSPSGEYGQWVKGQVGRVATPVGAYQVVGTTLRDAIRNGVVDPNAKFDQSTQDKIGAWILSTQGTGAWEGYKGPRAPQNQPRGQGVQVAGDGATVDQIMQFMASDAYNYATPEQKSALGMLLQQRMQANDPLRQQQLAMGEIELDRARNPQTEWKIEELADGRKYYVDPKGRQEPRLVNPGLDVGAGDGEMTESERRIFMFNTIQQKTGPAINRIEDIGFDPSNIRDKLSNGVLGGNWFASKEGQMYEAAAGSWAESALRLATGAAATPEEYQRIRNMYFAAVGDDPQTIAFKRSMREAYQGVLEQTLNGKADPNQANPLMFALDQIYGSESAPISSPRPPSRTQETASTTRPQRQSQWNGPSASEIYQMSPMQINSMLSAYDLKSIPDDVLAAIEEVLQ